MNIDRNRRYARLMAMARKADDATAKWAWWSAKEWSTYIAAIRFLQA